MIGDVCSIKRVLVSSATAKTLVGMGITIHPDVSGVILRNTGTEDIFYTLGGLNTDNPTAGVPAAAVLRAESYVVGESTYYRGPDAITLPATHKTIKELTFLAASARQESAYLDVIQVRECLD